jgi:hypothetical protein
MSAEIRYLSQRSLAVYEATLIEQFAISHRRNVKVQAFIFGVFAASFLFLAAMTVLLPANIQGFLHLLLVP